VRIFSAALIAIGLSIILFIFGPYIREELRYSFNRMSGVEYSVDTLDVWSFQRPINIPDIDFSIIIPKLNATSKVVENVDPLNQDEYLNALKSGVAHAKGSASPGSVGNVFLFAHSTDSLVNVGRYNAVFFLIGHLLEGDEIDIYYKGRLYKYIVYDKKVVEPTDSEYLGTLTAGEKTLTLQTCYPPGTTLKRLVVLAKLQESK
jgi:sortase A